MRQNKRGLLPLLVRTPDRTSKNGDWWCAHPCPLLLVHVLLWKASQIGSKRVVPDIFSHFPWRLVNGNEEKWLYFLCPIASPIGQNYLKHALPKIQKLRKAILESRAMLGECYSTEISDFKAKACGVMWSKLTRVHYLRWGERCSQCWPRGDVAVMVFQVIRSTLDFLVPLWWNESSNILWKFLAAFWQNWLQKFNLVGVILPLRFA